MEPFTDLELVILLSGVLMRVDQKILWERQDRGNSSSATEENRLVENLTSTDLIKPFPHRGNPSLLVLRDGSPDRNLDLESTC